MADNKTSKYIALILRHKPDVIGITLDEHGWAGVDELIAGIAKTRPFSMTELEVIVKTDEKQRYEFNRNKTLIRACQGHSVQVDIEFEKAKPPEYLYHGTAEKYTASIEKQGLLPKSRLLVHLSTDYDTAVITGARHGKPVVYRIRAEQMAHDGYDFYLSANGVWQTDCIPPGYISRYVPE